jgi:hypothetical protein
MAHSMARGQKWPNVLLLTLQIALTIPSVYLWVRIRFFSLTYGYGDLVLAKITLPLLAIASLIIAWRIRQSAPKSMGAINFALFALQLTALLLLATYFI